MTIKRQSSPILKLLAAYIVLTAIHAILLTTLGMVFHMRNHFQQNNYMYLRFPLLALIYYLSFRQFKSRGIWLCILFWCLTPFFLWFNFQAFGWNTIHIPYLTAGATMVILCVVLYLYNMLASDRVLNPARYPLFWTSIGLLLLFLTVLPSRGLLYLLVNNNLLLAQHASIPLFLMNLITYSMISADFIIQWKQQKAAELSASR
ncbi:MAG: hypothetical protein MUF29_05650 [Chitinophagaceae bacterium]|nr:hypothetical protein [Chitinophagaceae bacterium]